MPQLHDFQFLSQAQAIMGTLVQEVKQEHFTAYICPRVLGRNEIDPAVTLACEKQGLTVLCHEAPKPTYDVHAIIDSSHWDAMVPVVNDLANKAQQQGLI